MSEKRPERLALVALLLSLAFIAFAAVVGIRWANSYLITTSLVPLALIGVFSFLAWWEAVLRRREREESEEQERVARQYDREDLFGDQADNLRLAAAAREQFHKYFIPALTAVGGLVLAATALMVWYRWATTDFAPIAAEPLPAAGLCGFLMVFCMLIGSYYNGVSREARCRWLRPIGAWYLATSAIFALAILVMLGKEFKIADADYTAARLVLGVLVFFGAEMIVDMILEFYRPRLPAEEPRPVYESKVLSFVTEPGGIARNVAHALDYQFGFKVSETWFYGFVEKSVIPFFLILVAALYALDFFAVVDTSQVGLRESYWLGGRYSSTECSPGFYLKWPWPFQTMRKVNVYGVRSVNVGFTTADDGEHEMPDEPPEPGMEDKQGDPTGRVIVWGKTHFKTEKSFLVASGEMLREMQTQAAGDEGRPPQTTAVPVNFLAVNVEVQYRVDPAKVKDYAYNYTSPAKVVQEIAMRETTNYLASTDFFKFIGRGMLAGRQELEERITRAIEDGAPDKSLGVEVTFVSLANVHPPVNVAPAFQKVLAADEERLTSVYTAKKDAATIHYGAVGKAARTLNDAEAYASDRKLVSEGEVAEFEAQLTAFKRAPDVFRLRRYLEALVEVIDGKRKFYVGTDPTTATGVVEINLEEKIRQDLLDLNTEKTE